MHRYFATSSLVSTLRSPARLLAGVAVMAAATSVSAEPTFQLTPSSSSPTPGIFEAGDTFSLTLSLSPTSAEEVFGGFGLGLNYSGPADLLSVVGLDRTGSPFQNLAGFPLLTPSPESPLGLSDAALTSEDPDFGAVIEDDDFVGVSQSDDIFLLELDFFISPDLAADTYTISPAAVFLFDIEFNELNFIAEDFTFEVIPEPASFLLLVGGIGLFARRRRDHAGIKR